MRTYFSLDSNAKYGPAGKGYDWPMARLSTMRQTLFLTGTKTIPTDRWHNVTDNTLPESRVNSLPAVSLDKNFKVSWGGSDKASGIYAYAVYEGNAARGMRSVKVNLSTLPAGFYFVRIHTKQGVQTRKLIKK